MAAFKIGDYVRLYYVRKIEHTLLMSIVKQVKEIRQNAEEGFEYMIDLNLPWAEEKNLRHACKHEILEYKLCQ